MVTSLCPLCTGVSQMNSPIASVRRRRKSIDSSWKSNCLSRRRKKYDASTWRRRCHRKNIKSPGTFNKNYCELNTAITHTKILVAYFIISDKKLKYKWRISAARPTYYFVGIIFLFFWATVCKTVRPMPSDRLSVCPVCLWRWCIVAKGLDETRWNLAWR